ncbi:biotin/lipoyl-containing protein [Micromonospora sp. KC721]|uniref:acetyl-CoA carboxylase biotin carboxyl carrier protein n=1 Tax=Micromonospora sp. KC721 TaxID=2530380 RepID=UPI0010528ED1|nr:biotin/lipoyl-containing protein [Micromonospora sp. KC721]TDB80627.1 acetyl-CoA carboxylase biotin carboxyl carrier protein subunit [Micromonospora sp. KC721]
MSRAPDGTVEEPTRTLVNGATTPALTDDGVGRALDQVRHTAMRLLAELGHAPHALRLRAGEVSMEIEWDQPSVPGAVNAEAASAASAPSAADQPAGDAAPAGKHHVVAPTVGVFYRAPQPGAPPFVEVGDAVRPGQQVGIVEAMKLMIPVNADVAGQVTAVLTDNGASVEYGEPLIAIAPADE